jgi:predicted ATPase/class 3 adenylate cyclase
MDSLPTGTVTFLFTDIEGSTHLAQTYPDEWDSLQARHHTILRLAIEAWNGYIFQIIGDAFCAAFSTAHDGLSAAIDAQRNLQTENWRDQPVKVRMGIHTGSAEWIGGDYHGYLTLAKVQRIMSVANGAQVISSNASIEMVRGKLPSNVSLLDLGEHRLKGILNPEHLWQVCGSGLLQDFPPLPSLNTIPNNLPVQLTSFVGREKEIAEVKHQLNTHRLVTLTGSGGTGKTRLSLQVAAEVLDHFTHGVWFVELAPLTDPELVPQIILSTIGISEQPSKAQIEILKEYLHGKNIMIVLDNCEHLIESSASVVNILLNAAPYLRILASSREALGVKGELSYPVPSLSLPDIKHLPVLKQLSKYEAVQLFIDRALLVAPHFEVDKNNAPFIAQICYRLDGIPLAIELAAARVKMLSPEQISARLDDRFRLLTGGARTSLPRQQTLRALIDWSYDLLSDNERLLLERLSAFAGGWTLEAAEEVCAGDSVENYDVLEHLTQLVNKSLVTVMENSQSGETRYRMLETIQRYANEKLVQSGKNDELRGKHLAYFVKLVEQAEPELYRADQVFWFNKLDDELGNLRIALEWALATDIEAGLLIASISWRFWDTRGYLRELGNWLSQLLEIHTRANTLHTQSLAVYSFCYYRQANFYEAIKLAEYSLQMSRTLSSRRLEAFSLSLLGMITLLHGGVGEGTHLLEQGLAIYRALGDKIGQANTLERLSYLINSSEGAITTIKESLGLYRELGNLNGIAVCLSQLSQITIWSGDFSSSAPWLEEALSISRQLGNQTIEGNALQDSGYLAYCQGNYQQAISYYREAILLAEKSGDHFQYLWAHVRMAHAVLRRGEIQQAREMFEKSIRDTQKADLLIALVFAVEGLASLNINQAQSERAPRLFAWADAMREKFGNNRPPVEQAFVEKDLAIIHSKVEDAEFEKLCNEGRALTTEQAIALALEKTHV